MDRTCGRTRWQESGRSRTGRSTGARRAAGFLLATALLSGCSHFKPYYRSGGLPLDQDPAASQIDHRLLLIGDAGDANPDGEPALELLAKRARLLPEQTTVVYLGDNVYERGMPPPGQAEAADQAAQAANFFFPKVFDSREKAEQCLNAEIDVVRGTPARSIFVPGNHDWDPFAAGGWKRIVSSSPAPDLAAASMNACWSTMRFQPPAAKGSQS